MLAAVNFANVFLFKIKNVWKTKNIKKRIKNVCYIYVWNSVPKTIVNNDSVAVFKSRLKTFLFSRAFSFPSSQQHTDWSQRLWSYDLMALYTYVYYYYYYFIPQVVKIPGVKNYYYYYC